VCGTFVLRWVRLISEKVPVLRTPVAVPGTKIRCGDRYCA